MSGVNKVILLGRLGKDPEVRVLEGDRKVAKFPLATSETYKDKTGQRVESTEWHNVEFWGPVVDVIDRYVKKGDMLYVEGKIRTRSYEDKEGQKKYVTDIVGQNLTLLGGKSNEAQAEPSAASMGQPAGFGGNDNSNVASSSYINANDESDDLPF
jgi:single-strand DNA-binding protein